jgi:hypothetical protein
MKSKQAFLLVAATCVLAACGGTTADTAARPAASATPASAAAATAAAGPTATQAMVCGDEITGKVTQVLRLPGAPVTSSTYAAGLFSCHYTLPMGPMLLSVQRSPSKAAAMAYLTARRAAVGATQNLLGLGERAFATTTGVVLVIKDNETLEVDTTGLPVVFGPLQQKRTDLAYEIASDVLGCWTGDEH